MPKKARYEDGDVVKDWKDSRIFYMVESDTIVRIKDKETKEALIARMHRDLVEAPPIKKFADEKPTQGSNCESPLSEPRTSCKPTEKPQQSLRGRTS
jgi:hypothetical protein